MSCQVDGNCSEAACAASATPSCALAVCDASFGRCLCPGASILLRGGACEEASMGLASANDCHPQSLYSAAMAVGMWPGPELAAWNVSDLEGPFGHVLWACLASATGRAVQEIVVLQSATSADFTPSVASSLRLFDWEFTFCSTSSLAIQDPSSFERLFNIKAQSYEAFEASTLRLLQRPSAGWTDTTTSTASASPQVDAHPVHFEAEEGFWTTWWWLPWAGIALCLLAVVAIMAWSVARRFRSSSKRCSQGDDSLLPPLCAPDGTMLQWVGGADSSLPAKTTTTTTGGHASASATMMTGIVPVDSKSCTGSYWVQVFKLATRAETGYSEEQQAQLALSLLPVELGEVVEVLAQNQHWLYARTLPDGPTCQAAASGFLVASCCCIWDPTLALFEADSPKEAETAGGGGEGEGQGPRKTEVGGEGGEGSGLSPAPPALEESNGGMLP